MLQNNKSVVKVKAILTRGVSYQGAEGEVKLNPGTIVIVDPEKNIALAGDEHFFINQEEYKVLYLN